MVICNEGYQSSLAAANLQRLGLGKATDMIGGFCAWKEARLPVVAFDESLALMPVREIKEDN